MNYLPIPAYTIQVYLTIDFFYFKYAVLGILLISIYTL